MTTKKHTLFVTHGAQNAEAVARRMGTPEDPWRAVSYSASGGLGMLGGLQCKVILIDTGRIHEMTVEQRAHAAHTLSMRIGPDTVVAVLLDPKQLNSVFNATPDRRSLSRLGQQLASTSFAAEVLLNDLPALVEALGSDPSGKQTFDTTVALLKRIALNPAKGAET